MLCYLELNFNYVKHNFNPLITIYCDDFKIEYSGYIKFKIDINKTKPINKKCFLNIINHHFNNYKKIRPKPICLDNVEFNIRYCDDHKIRKKGMLHSVRFHALEMDEESTYLIGSYDYLVWK